MSTRRSFLRQSCAAAAFGYVAAFRNDAVARVRAAVADAGGATPQELASHEDFWFQVQRAYDVDRSITNLNNGGVAPAPSMVLAAQGRNEAITNHAPSRYLWAVLDPQVETVRRRLADHFGCDAEEIAITRNSSEALQICLFGLDLRPGDEVLATAHDYPRMLNTLKQREAREGIVLRTFEFDTPPKSKAELAALFEKNVTPKTRAILMCHITNLTGQIFPVKEVVHMARQRHIEVIVDGAHAFAHFPFHHADLDCDYYGTSLHKWCSAPIGTGFLYVRKSKIANLWPLMAAPDPKKDDIRKFEEIGTHPTAPRLAIAEALSFYEGIGAERKIARLTYLRDRHAARLTKLPKVRCYTSLEAGMGGAICTLGVEGLDAGALTGWLWDKHKIVVTPIVIGAVNGIRITPNTYTTLAEVDRFADAFEHAVNHGIA
ncbi:MAG: aminotransferase class V-fold PLP-dependent enzyme [Phycisphaerales bacterium]|nr:aminotransferase class V-fold PLP-dependent enzyme [Phycisphaerales bacterium]